jgi:hypothetical protein
MPDKELELHVFLRRVLTKFSSKEFNNNFHLIYDFPGTFHFLGFHEMVRKFGFVKLFFCFFDVNNFADTEIKVD